MYVYAVPLRVLWENRHFKSIPLNISAFPEHSFLEEFTVPVSQLTVSIVCCLWICFVTRLYLIKSWNFYSNVVGTLEKLNLSSFTPLCAIVCYIAHTPSDKRLFVFATLLLTYQQHRLTWKLNAIISIHGFVLMQNCLWGL